jgi:hypothetical protein
MSTDTFISNWPRPKRLTNLDAFYEAVRRDPSSATDEEFLRRIADAHSGTNALDYAEDSFGIIGPGCLLRPHLTRKLITHPLGALIAAGVEDVGQMISIGIACATSERNDVKPTAEGVQWLVQIWPQQIDLVREVVEALLYELASDEN